MRLAEVTLVVLQESGTYIANASQDCFLGHTIQHYAIFTA